MHFLKAEEYSRIRNYYMKNCTKSEIMMSSGFVLTIIALIFNLIVWVFFIFNFVTIINHFFYYIFSFGVCLFSGILFYFYTYVRMWDNIKSLYPDYDIFIQTRSIFYVVFEINKAIDTIINNNQTFFIKEYLIRMNKKELLVMINYIKAKQEIIKDNLSSLSSIISMNFGIFISIVFLWISVDPNQPSYFYKALITFLLTGAISYFINEIYHIINSSFKIFNPTFREYDNIIKYIEFLMNVYIDYETIQQSFVSYENT